jgi:hypothetical protein
MKIIEGKKLLKNQHSLFFLLFVKSGFATNIKKKVMGI